MSNAMIERVANEWLSNYTTAFLKDFEGEGEVLAKQRQWCQWLKSQMDTLTQQFQTHLIETNHFPASPAVIKEQWEEWIYSIFHSLTEEWLAGS